MESFEKKSNNSTMTDSIYNILYKGSALDSLTRDQKFPW